MRRALRTLGCAFGVPLMLRTSPGTLRRGSGSVVGACTARQIGWFWRACTIIQLSPFTLLRRHAYVGLRALLLQTAKGWPPGCLAVWPPGRLAAWLPFPRESGSAMCDVPAKRAFDLPFRLSATMSYLLSDPARYPFSHLTALPPKQSHFHVAIPPLSNVHIQAANHKARLANKPKSKPTKQPISQASSQPTSQQSQPG